MAEFTGGLNAFRKPLEGDGKKNWDTFWDNLEKKKKDERDKIQGQVREGDNDGGVGPAA